MLPLLQQRQPDDAQASVITKAIEQETPPDEPDVDSEADIYQVVHGIRAEFDCDRCQRKVGEPIRNDEASGLFSELGEAAV